MGSPEGKNLQILDLHMLASLLKEVGLLALEELHHVVEHTNARIIHVPTFSLMESQTKCSSRKYQKTWWLAPVVVIRKTQSHVLLKKYGSSVTILY